MAPLLNPPPSDPAVAPPARRPCSVRRTSTVLMFWPDGLGTDLHLKGRARDLFTPERDEPVVVSHADLYAVTGRERDIRSIRAQPPMTDLECLVGCRAGANLRSAIAQQLPDEVESGTPLHLLLDDLAGSTLIAGFVYFRWADHFPEIRQRISTHRPERVMRDICSGFRDGSSALLPDGTISRITHNTAHPGPLADPTDPLSFHELDDHPEIAMRRARRIDVWEEDGMLGIDAMFRDSAWDPDGQEVVVHEYQMLGRADRATGRLLAVDAIPRVLPYAECPAAAPNASWMAGTDLRAMRTEVLERLQATDCCTHLNDGLRSLAEVPVLAASLSTETTNGRVLMEGPQ
ncbi:MAG: DUF2889 domain-containing protein [Acidimicrobiales bacterium]